MDRRALVQRGSRRLKKSKAKAAWWRGGLKALRAANPCSARFEELAGLIGYAADRPGLRGEWRSTDEFDELSSVGATMHLVPALQSVDADAAFDQGALELNSDARIADFDRHNFCAVESVHLAARLLGVDPDRIASIELGEVVDRNALEQFAELLAVETRPVVEVHDIVGKQGSLTLCRHHDSPLVGADQSLGHTATVLPLFLQIVSAGRCVLGVTQNLLHRPSFR